MIKKLFTVLIYAFAAVGFFLVAGYFAVKFGLTNERGVIDEQRESFLEGVAPVAAEETYTGPWQSSEEWKVMEAAIRRDEAVINRAAADAGVPARLIVANLVAEQLRLFFTEREAYKKWFYPLKILGPQSQFSWGVMGMKEDTAIEVEQNLVNPASPRYLGASYEHKLNFSTGDVKQERFTRMTDQYDHYWSYLYAGLYLKQVMVEWERAGFPITDRPEILSTLYNIGFRHSVPKADPKVGGAGLTIAGNQYSFGGLAAEFYNSELLVDMFPR
ncbi:MAG TPA: hypothetical protein VEA92_03625 [Candidatus Paceibacterota bacterium]|nr:hypothetical protein [Candidatus Paceibacterota bacterium]